MASQRLPSALVADADRGRNAVLCDHLAAAGWNVHATYDGPSALRVLRSREVRLAIVQCPLPGMDGVAVVCAALANGRHFHAVFLDSTERPWFGPQCAALGALAYVVTPVSTDALDIVLREALQRPPPEAQPRRASASPASDPSRGDRVRLVVASGPSAGSYPAIVVDTGPAALVLSAWASDGSPVYLSLGTAAVVGFPAGNGWGELKAQVTGSYASKSVVEISLSHTGRATYAQRRRSERVSVSLPIRAWPAGARAPADAMVAGHTEDIGSKGLRACFSGSLVGSGMVMLAISPVAGGGEARLIGRRVWQETVGEPGQQWHRYGFRFTSLSRDATHRLDALLAAFSASQQRHEAGPHPSLPDQGGPGPPVP